LASEKQLKNYPALIHMEAIYHAQTEHFEESLAAFAMASKTLPRDATLFYNMACLLRAMKRLSAAMEAIDRSLRLNPFNPL
ncbi:hypothetical protein, partial [Vibrio alginolyticus]|uniref:hypothetical protein n=1 Tax=Vibrio alginolyticus TaxID=663 RepID=UPI001A8CF0D0